MGQKIHPTGFRLSVTATGLPAGTPTARTFRRCLKEDIEVRDYLKKKLAHASVGRVVIERPAKTPG
jgi:small subunit ribosomal protein S3